NFLSRDRTRHRIYPLHLSGRHLRLCRRTSSWRRQQWSAPTVTDPTFMRQEVDQIPEVVAGFLEGSSAALDAAAARLRDLDPALVVTVARGSSDHASAYLKYAFELTLGLPVASVGP